MRKHVDAKLDDAEMKDPRVKFRALKAATAHSFPTADIEEMLTQIERGYCEES